MQLLLTELLLILLFVMSVISGLIDKSDNVGKLKKVTAAYNLFLKEAFISHTEENKHQTV